MKDGLKMFRRDEIKSHEVIFATGSKFQTYKYSHICPLRKKRQFLIYSPFSQGLFQPVFVQVIPLTPPARSLHFGRIKQCETKMRFYSFVGIRPWSLSFVFGVQSLLIASEFYPAHAFSFYPIKVYI
jgi:hypothetical protein